MWSRKVVCFLFIHFTVRQKKLPEGNVFSLFCLSVCLQDGGSPCDHTWICSNLLICNPYIYWQVNRRQKGLLVFRVILRVIQNYVCGMRSMLLAVTDLEVSNRLEIFLVKFYRICQICRILFSVILIFKIITISILQILQKTIEFLEYHFS